MRFSHHSSVPSGPGPKASAFPSGHSRVGSAGSGRTGLARPGLRRPRREGRFAHFRRRPPLLRHLSSEIRQLPVSSSPGSAPFDNFRQYFGQLRLFPSAFGHLGLTSIISVTVRRLFGHLRPLPAVLRKCPSNSVNLRLLLRSPPQTSALGLGAGGAFEINYS